jgi:hypothetical protein
MPRPKFKPTGEQRNLVKSMAGMGIRHEEIARKIGISSPKTLRKHFRAELDEGATDANYNVAHALYKNAMAGNVTAQIYWSKARGGWRERPAFEPASTAPPPFIVAQDNGVQP